MLLLNGKPRLAGALGFEPRNGGTKNRCLTTWRRPSSGAGDSLASLWAQDPRWAGRWVRLTSKDGIGWRLTGGPMAQQAVDVGDVPSGIVRSGMRRPAIRPGRRRRGHLRHRRPHLMPPAPFTRWTCWALEPVQDARPDHRGD